MRAEPRVVQDSASDRRAKFGSGYRLLRATGFDHVIHAESISDTRFKVFFVGNDRKNARLGIVVAKKKVFQASSRNRIKRLIREAFRQHIVSSRNLDIVVMGRELGSHVESVLTANLNNLFSRVESKCEKL